jgi:Ni,Fe-hydrogenase III large subunit
LEEERPYWEEYFELLAQRRNYIQALTLVERVCGICSNVHTLTMCMAAEAIAGIELPLCANYMRSCTI